MRGPRHLGPYPDRLLDCQFEAEPAFHQIITDMEARGWVREEVVKALRLLAINETLADQANAETDAAIAEALRRRAQDGEGT